MRIPTLLVAGATLLAGLPFAFATAPAPQRSGVGTVEETYEVTVTNLTRGQVFAPILAATHDGGAAFYELGAPASPELAELAEEGNGAPLRAVLDGLPSVYATQVGSGPIPPGQSDTFEITSEPSKRLISLAGMLVQTNDAFLALDSELLPRVVGARRSRLAHALDAGSEFNCESCDFIPGPPCNSGGAHNPIPSEGYVYVSNGIHGGGNLGPARYDWRGPVARVQIRRVR